jgi:hypothetical protein
MMANDLDSQQKRYMMILCDLYFTGYKQYFIGEREFTTILVKRKDAFTYFWFKPSILLLLMYILEFDKNEQSENDIYLKALLKSKYVKRNSESLKKYPSLYKKLVYLALKKAGKSVLRSREQLNTTRSYRPIIISG